MKFDSDVCFSAIDNVDEDSIDVADSCCCFLILIPVRDGDVDSDGDGNNSGSILS